MSGTGAMQNNYGNRSEKELALWMLERMRDSEEFLGVIRAARRAGRPDVLDNPDYIAKHAGRLGRLYKGDAGQSVEAPADLAGVIDALASRDVLAGREDMIEKAIAAYLERHPKGAEGLPKEWASTIALARGEIEGRTSGAFKPGFVAELAAAARTEMDRQAASGKARGKGHES